MVVYKPKIDSCIYLRIIIFFLQILFFLFFSNIFFQTFRIQASNKMDRQDACCSSAKTKCGSPVQSCPDVQLLNRPQSRIVETGDNDDDNDSLAMTSRRCLQTRPANSIKFRKSLSVLNDCIGSTIVEHEFRKRSNSWPTKTKAEIMRQPSTEYEQKLVINLNKELGIDSGKQMKNQWGNLSYSQLIERAIESSTWKCLSLKEIYAWFAKYVPYFRDKMHYKSTTGWKVHYNEFFN
jgi:hypothetical protein